MIVRIVAGAVLGLALVPGSLVWAADGSDDASEATATAGASEDTTDGEGSDEPEAEGAKKSGSKGSTGDGEATADKDDREAKGDKDDGEATGDKDDGEAKGDKDDGENKGKKNKDGKSKAEVRWEPGEGVSVRAQEPKASVVFSAWLRPAFTLDIPAPDASPSARIVSGSLDRARVSFAFELPHGIDGEVGIGFDHLDVAPTDLFVRWKPADAFALRVGRQRVPFGRDRLTSSRSYPFVERGAPSALATGRAFGAQVESRLVDERLRFTLGLFQGASSSTFDDDRNADLVGRLLFAPAPTFAVGLGGSARFRPDGIEGLAGMDGVAGALLEARPFIGAAGGGGVDIVVSPGPLRLLVEAQVLREGLTIGTASGHLVAAAGQLMVGVAPVGVREHAASGGGIGAGLEILGRVDVLHLAPAPGDRAPATRLGVSAGVLGAPTSWLRVGAELEIGRRFGLGQDTDPDARILLSATVGT